MGSTKAFSDSSITKPPEKDMKIGNGQLVSITYDGSKGGPSLFYQLSYVDPEGEVRSITGGPFRFQRATASSPETSKSSLPMQTVVPAS